MFLIDTNVLSALAPKKGRVASELADWLVRNTERIFLSVVTIAEIESGIAKAEREAAAAADRLTAWLEAVVMLYEPRILPVTVGVARFAGRMVDAARGQGHTPGFADVLIGATAKSAGFVVLTRNLRHFEPLGVAAHDPFTAVPRDATPG